MNLCSKQMSTQTKIPEKNFTLMSYIAYTFPCFIVGLSHCLDAVDVKDMVHKAYHPTQCCPWVSVDPHAICNAHWSSPQCVRLV